MLNLHKALGAYCEFETEEDLFSTPVWPTGSSTCGSTRPSAIGASGM